jgi:CubicO group peptidase (beta-lactamase class C family)
LKPAANWDIPTLAGAGAIRSTADDMLTFLAANITPAGPTAAAIELSHAVRFKVPESPHDLALGWHVRREPHLVWHNGQTGGYHSWAGFSPEKKLGVVVLANTAGLHIDELGLALVELLAGNDPKPLRVPAAISLSAEALEPFVGKYQLAPLVMVNVTRENDQLYVQLTGQPRLALVPADKQKFFVRAVEANFEFSRDDAGKVTGLVLHQGGQDLPAPRKEPAEK